MALWVGFVPSAETLLILSCEVYYDITIRDAWPIILCLYTYEETTTLYFVLVAARVDSGRRADSRYYRLIF